MMRHRVQIPPKSIPQPSSSPPASATRFLYILLYIPTNTKEYFLLPVFTLVMISYVCCSMVYAFMFSEFLRKKMKA